MMCVLNFNYDHTRHAWHPDGTYFFTVNLLQRSGNDLLVRITHRFTIHAWVVLLDHLHCVIELLIGDADFAVRWR